jgi:hypothetical protein
VRLFATLLVLLALAGCGGKGVTYDKEVEDLGAHIAAELQALPTMSSATYRYVHGLDLGQQLRVRAILKQESVSDQAIGQATDTAVKTFWLSPANVDNLRMDVYSAANPPNGDDDESNKDRVLKSTSIDVLDHDEMVRKYGPRPTHPPK